MCHKVKCRDYELVSVTVYDRVKVALRACVRMDTIVSSTSGWKLPDNEADEYEHCAFVYASYSSRLGQIFEGLGKRLFDVTIKYHYMCHMGLAARHLHPRFTWCYMQEDLMLIIRRLCKSCVPGSDLTMVPRKLVKLACHAKHLKMCERHEVFRD